jgi:hypothetical protein
LRSATYRVPVADLYCGRAFRQAEQAALHARAGFFVVSAGLGLVPASSSVPSYSLTIASGSADNVLRRVSPAPSPAQWWDALKRSSPFATSLADAVGSHRGPIMIALPGMYLELVGEELASLPSRTRSRFRVFTLNPASAIPEALRPFVLPYDARFDGPDAPLPGTRSDFAQRSLAHFVEAVLAYHPKADFDGHAEGVEKLLSGLRRQSTPVRTRQSDGEIISLIHRHWSAARGQSSRMLRLLRDDLGVACEQGRFRTLFLAARQRREPCP